MTDYFALLEQPRRPWLDLELLKQSYHRLSLNAHPDTGTAAASVSSATLNDGYRTLENTKLRIQHLLALEGAEPEPTHATVPSDIADLFWDAGALSKEVDALLADAGRTTTGLAQSLLRRRVADLQRRATITVAKLDHLHDAALARLRAIDATWDSHRDIDGLRELHQRFSYLTRWLDQFREKLFQLRQL